MKTLLSRETSLFHLPPDITENSRIPKPIIAHEALPATNDCLELAERPRFLEERRFGGRVNIHELEVEDHVELAVLRKNVSGELGCLVCKGRFADCDEVVVCGSSVGL